MHHLAPWFATGHSVTSQLMRRIAAAGYFSRFLNESVWVSGIYMPGKRPVLTGVTESVFKRL